MSNNKYDIIITGAGISGCVIARILAERHLSVLILEQRSHIGGNVYDCFDESGILIHLYGPHIFHTNNEEVYNFLSRFTVFNGYEHTVLASIYGELMPVPFNLKALYQAFENEQAELLERKLAENYGAGGTVSILELMNHSDMSLAELGKYVYDNIFEKYTVKQWDMPPEKINPATTARVPVRISDDCRYFTDKFQGLPDKGYTEMLKQMLEHPNIDVKLNCECSEHITLSENKVYYDGELFEGAFVYTGKPDDLLGEKYGSLPYRTLDFEFETLDTEFFQPCGTVNYTVDMPYTRITEFKHMTKQQAEKTTILKEYSKAYTPHTDEIPYYPVINQESLALYKKYTDELSKYKRLYLAGRLGEYKYYNMDAVCEKAMILAEKIALDMKR